MATIKLKVSDNILDKVLWLLSQFKKEDLQILESNHNFEETKAYVQKELKRLETGESASFSIQEVDNLLENTVRGYEH
jgi:hypothetical protein